jgi:hypothetical protein
VLRRLGLIALCTGLTFALTPTSATANIVRWVDKLSGPGPFKGFEIEWRLVCLGDPQPSYALSDPGEVEKQRAAAEKEVEDDGKINKKARAAATALGLLAPGCVVDKVEKGALRRSSVNVAFGVFASTKNRLVYNPPGTDEKDPFNQVKLTTLELSFDYRLVRGVDAGAGIAAYFFSGARFDAFTRLALEPIRLSWRPVAMFASDSKCLPTKSDSPCWQRMLVVRTSYFVIPHGFDAEDFGATPGTFRTSRDKLFSYAFMADTEPLYRWLKKQF